MGFGGGALVCPSLSVTSRVYNLLMEDWHRRILANSGAGQMADDLYGKARPVNPEDFDCTIAPPDTLLYLDRTRMLWHVSGTLADGRSFEGMTLNAMLTTVVGEQRVPNF